VLERLFITKPNADKTIAVPVFKWIAAEPELLKAERHAWRQNFSLANIAHLSYNDFMINMQIAVDENLLAEIEKAGERQGLDLAQIVREALQTWLKRRDGLRREGMRFEQEWIATLKKNPDDASRAEEWLEAQAWSEP
jgi:hypothetical protein